MGEVNDSNDDVVKDLDEIIESIVVVVSVRFWKVGKGNINEDAKDMFTGSGAHSSWKGKWKIWKDRKVKYAHTTKL